MELFGSRLGFAVLKKNISLLEELEFTPAASATTKGDIYVPGAYTISFFFKQKTAYEIASCLVGSEMCIRDSYSSASTGGRHQVMHEQTGSEPPNRCPPDLLVNTYFEVHHTFAQGGGMILF